jgi:predicted Ser/Thr protein kinase
MKTKYSTIKNVKRAKLNNRTKKYKKNQSGGKLCPGNGNVDDIYTLGKHYMSATNEIYESLNDPNILIKQIKKPKVNDDTFNNYNIENIKKELELAQFCSDIKISPYVYHTSICVDENYIIGYIVMKKIQGKIINSEKELNKHFKKIYHIFNTLLISGIRYNDYNINNFIVENKTNHVYVIDFEDATKVTMEESIYGSNLKLDRKAVKELLIGSIRE